MSFLSCTSRPSSERKLQGQGRVGSLTDAKEDDRFQTNELQLIDLHLLVTIVDLLNASTRFRMIEQSLTKERMQFIQCTGILNDPQNEQVRPGCFQENELNRGPNNRDEG